MKIFANKPIIVLLCLLAMLAGMFLAVFTSKSRQAVVQNATVFDFPRKLPTITLTDHRGQDFNNEQLEGHWSILFFGFTHCPDVCPTTMTVLAKSREQLELTHPELDVSVFMVSVDPERDTVEKLATYVPFFDPEFVGLTSSIEVIDALVREMGVAYSRTPQEGGGYTVEHTSALFVINPTGELAAVSSAPHLPRILASDLAVIATN